MNIRSDPSANFERFIGVFTILLIFFIAARVPLDPDLWWHLRAGQDTLTAQMPVQWDSYSYTAVGNHWLNHSWGSQIILAGLNAFGGALALGAYTALTAVLSMLLIWRRMHSPPILRSALLLLAGFTASTFWSPRPQMWSLVGLGILMHLTDPIEKGGWKRIAAIFGLFAVWGNLHGGFALGLIYLGALLGGQVFSALQGRPRAGRWKGIWRVMMMITAACGGLILNPFGVGILTAPFQTIGVETLRRFISEWASPDFHQDYQRLFLILFILLAASVWANRKRVDPGRLVSVLAFTALALSARRNFAPFAMVTIPFVDEMIRSVLSEIKVIRKPAKPTREKIYLPYGMVERRVDPRRVINLILVGLMGLACLVKLYAVTHPTVVNGYTTNIYPARAVEWIRNSQPQGRLFNAYNWGGYLIYQLPEYPVFVDGRTDLFGDRVLEEWLHVVNGNEDWQLILDKYEIGIILLEPGQPVIQNLSTTDWQLQYSDATAVVYTRTTD